MHFLKTQSKILFKSNQSSDNVVTKNIAQTKTPLDQDPSSNRLLQTAANWNKYKKIFLTKSKPVQKAEILIAMKSVISHISHNSLDNFAQLCKIMFTDSTIASDYVLDEQR